MFLPCWDNYQLTTLPSDRLVSKLHDVDIVHVRKCYVLHIILSFAKHIIHNTYYDKICIRFEFVMPSRLILSLITILILNNINYFILLYNFLFISVTSKFSSSYNKLSYWLLLIFKHPFPAYFMLEYHVLGLFPWRLLHTLQPHLPWLLQLL